MEAGYRDPEPGAARFFDTHAHISSRNFNADRDKVLKRAGDAGVTFIDEPSSFAGIALAEEIGIYCAAGIHPHDALGQDALDRRWGRLEDTITESNSVKAIGEIGLDYFRNLSPRNSQIDCFIAGLNLAKKLQLPVIIHERDAREDVLSVIRANHPGTSIIFHCFCHNTAHAQKCLDLNGYLGIGGPITYPRNHHVRDMLFYVPLDRLLVETDSPYLPPQSRRGKRNEPLYLVEVVQAIANILGASADEIGQLTLSNGKRAFGISS